MVFSDCTVRLARWTWTCEWGFTRVEFTAVSSVYENGSSTFGATTLLSRITWKAAVYQGESLSRFEKRILGKGSRGNREKKASLSRGRKRKNKNGAPVKVHTGCLLPCRKYRIDSRHKNKKKRPYEHTYDVTLSPSYSLFSVAIILSVMYKRRDNNLQVTVNTTLLNMSHRSLFLLSFPIITDLLPLLPTYLQYQLPTATPTNLALLPTYFQHIRLKNWLNIITSLNEFVNGTRYCTINFWEIDGGGPISWPLRRI